MSLLQLGAVTVAGYRLRTGDEDSAASSVSAALLEGESLLEEHLRRQLPLEERTGTFLIYPDGYVYPDAYPVVSAAGHTLDGSRAVGGATPDGGPFVGVWEPSTAARATVTWVGGFTAATFPVTLQQAIYDLARSDLSDLPSAPAGTSASVGDVSISGTVGDASAAIDAAVPGLASRVSRYVNRFV